MHSAKTTKCIMLLLNTAVQPESAPQKELLLLDGSLLFNQCCYRGFSGGFNFPSPNTMRWFLIMWMSWETLPLSLFSDVFSAAANQLCNNMVNHVNDVAPVHRFKALVWTEIFPVCDIWHSQR